MMLDAAPPPPPNDPEAQKRERRRIAQREYRRRYDAGRFTVPVEVGDEVISLLVHTLHKLDAAHSDNRKEIGKAISRALRETAEAEGWTSSKR